MTNWFFEDLYKSFYKQSIKKSKEVVNKKTKFQDLEIFENPFFGKVLTLDNIVQTTEKDEFFYHEMFVHVPLVTNFLFSQNKPENILIIGGGDGGILREVLKHNSVKKALMIELDEEVVKECKEHMPTLSNGAFNDPRADVRFIDGIDFIKKASESKEKFDVILVDSTDPIGAAEPLFTDQFYNNCYQCLNDNGILVTQSGVPFFQQAEMQNIHKKLRQFFSFVTFFIVPVPTYVGSFMVLSFASSANPLQFSINDYQKIFSTLKINNLRYYNSDIHFSSFLLPNYIKQSII